MDIFVNGKKVTVASASTVSSVAQALNENLNLLAVEINGELLDRALLKNYKLNENDQVELIRYMSGG